MAGSLAVVLIDQLYLNIALPGFIAQVIMPHKAIEIIGGGCTGVGLQSGDFRQLAQLLGHRLDHVGRDGKRRPFRHIHNDVEFRLVVERQHLDGDVLGIEQRASQAEKDPDAIAEHACLARAIEQRYQNFIIKKT